MRLIFMGTPQYAVPAFEKLLSSSHQIIAVFTQPDRPSGRGERIVSPPVKVHALERGICVHQPEKMNEDVWAPVIKQICADACIVVAYGKILPRWLLNLFPLGAFNLHASLLPRYRGAAPIQWAIANGENETGVTTMKLDEGMDTGDILLQEKVHIASEETAVELQARLAGIGANLLAHTIELLESNRLQPVRQDPHLATYAPLLKKEDGLIHWDNMTAEEIYNRIRAFNPWPGTYTLINHQSLRVWKALPCEMSIGIVSPGTLIQSSPEGPVVACRRGYLKLLEVQLESRKRTSAADMLNGLRTPKNQMFHLGQ
jgi:methionyl-tRNA formyltransferase